MAFTCPSQATPVSLYQWNITPFTDIVKQTDFEYTIRTTTITNFNTEEKNGRGFAPYIIAQVSGNFCISCKVQIVNSIQNPKIVSGIAVLDSKFNKIFEVGLSSWDTNGIFDTVPQIKGRPLINNTVFLGLEYISSSNQFRFHNGENEFRETNTHTNPITYVVLFMRGKDGVYETRFTDIKYNGLQTYTYTFNKNENYVKVPSTTTDALILDVGNATDVLNCETTCELNSKCNAYEFDTTTNICTLRSIVSPISNTETYSSSSNTYKLFINNVGGQQVDFDIDSTGNSMAILYPTVITVFIKNSSGTITVTNPDGTNEKYIFVGLEPTYTNPKEIRFGHNNDLIVSYYDSNKVRIYYKQPDERYSDAVGKFTDLNVPSPSKIRFFDNKNIVIVSSTTNIKIFNKNSPHALIATTGTGGETIDDIDVYKDKTIAVLCLKENLVQFIEFLTPPILNITENNITNNSIAVMYLTSGGLKQRIISGGSISFDKTGKYVSYCYYYNFNSISGGTTKIDSGSVLLKRQSDNSFKKDYTVKQVTTTAPDYALTEIVQFQRTFAIVTDKAQNKIYYFDHSDYNLKQYDILSRTHSSITTILGQGFQSVNGTCQDLALDSLKTNLYVVMIHPLIEDDGYIYRVNISTGQTTLLPLLVTARELADGTNQIILDNIGLKLKSGRRIVKIKIKGGEMYVLFNDNTIKPFYIGTSFLLLKGSKYFLSPSGSLQCGAFAVGDYGEDPNFPLNQECEYMSTSIYIRDNLQRRIVISDFVLNSNNTKIYACDIQNNVIRTIELYFNGLQNTQYIFSGQFGQLGTTDGDSNQTTFSNPSSITINSDDTKLYVSDLTSRKIREIDTRLATVKTLQTLSLDPLNIETTQDNRNLFILTRLNTVFSVDLYDKTVTSSIEQIKEETTYFNNSITTPIDTKFDSTGIYLAILDYNNKIIIYKRQGNDTFLNNQYDTININSNLSNPTKIKFDPFNRHLFVLDSDGIKKFYKQNKEEPSKFITSPVPTTDLYIKSIFTNLSLRLDFTPILKNVRIVFPINLKTIIFDSGEFLLITDKNKLISGVYYFHVLTYPINSGTTRLAIRFETYPTDPSFYLLTTTLDFNDELKILNEDFQDVMTLDENVNVRISKINSGSSININDNTQWVKSKILSQIQGMSDTRDYFIFKGNSIEYYENGVKVSTTQVNITVENFKITVKDLSRRIVAIFIIYSSNTIILSKINRSNNIFNVNAANSVPLTFNNNSEISYLHLINRTERLLTNPYVTLDEQLLKSLKSIFDNQRKIYEPFSQSYFLFYLYGRTFIMNDRYSFFFIDDQTLEYTYDTGKKETFKYFIYNGVIIYADIYGTINVICKKISDGSMWKIVCPIEPIFEDTYRVFGPFITNTSNLKNYYYNQLNSSERLKLDTTNSTFELEQLFGNIWLRRWDTPVLYYYFDRISDNYIFIATQIPSSLIELKYDFDRGMFIFINTSTIPITQTNYV